jgi:hypothetical protein
VNSPEFSPSGKKKKRAQTAAQKETLLIKRMNEARKRFLK